MGFLKFSSAVLLILGSVLPCLSAEIELLGLPGQSIKFVSIKGEIKNGDGSRFVDVIENLDQVTVILESPGGLVNEALEIGAEIRLRDFATMVLPDSECYSACGLIWVSGARRYISQSSQIGFHAAYREENGEIYESGVANAEIGSFLTHLGLRIEAIRFFTIAGPNDFLLLTPERARMLGIDVFEQHGFDVTTPSDAPTADTHAGRFVSYSFLQSRCIDFFQLDEATTNRGAEMAFDQGNRLVGHEKWIELWLPLLDEEKVQINTKGALLRCLEVEAKLRGQGQPTGIDGPSYACSKATTPTEKAMCADPNLWAKDRAMSAIYFWVRDKAEQPTKTQILEAQRRWLADRNSCDGNRSCLNDIYDRRLTDLNFIDDLQ